MKLVPVAGIDVGKNFSQLAVLNPDNKICARMTIYHNSHRNVNKAINLLKKMEKDFANRPIIAMEATGHYHKILSQSFINAGFKVVIINPIQTDSIKNLGIRKVKNDKVDAHRIALLYRFQEITCTSIPDEDIDCLKSLCRQYYKMNDQLTANKNKLVSILDQIMLNFTDVFNNVCSKTALAILEKYPTPFDIILADKESIINLIQFTARKGSEWAITKYELLVQKAKDFAPLSISTPANITMLKICINMVRTLDLAVAELENAIIDLIKTDKTKDMPILALSIELLCSIPGIGILTAATILAEVGDFSSFTKPGKLVAYCGLDPSVKESGKFKGTKNVLSKRGSKYLRRVLYTTALANIRRKRNGEEINPVLFKYYNDKCNSKCKGTVLGAVMHKLVDIIFAVMRDKQPFVLKTPEQHARLLNMKQKDAA